MLNCFWNVAFQSSAYLLYVLLTFDVFWWLTFRRNACILCFAVCCYVFHLLCFCSGQFVVMRVICLFGMFRWLFSVLLWATLLNLASVGGEWDGASSASLERRDVPPIEGPRGDGSAHPPCAIPSTP